MKVLLFIAYSCLQVFAADQREPLEMTVTVEDRVEIPVAQMPDGYFNGREAGKAPYSHLMARIVYIKEYLADHVPKVPAWLGITNNAVQLALITAGVAVGIYLIYQNNQLYQIIINQNGQIEGLRNLTSNLTQSSAVQFEHLQDAIANLSNQGTQHFQNLNPVISEMGKNVTDLFDQLTNLQSSSEGIASAMNQNLTEAFEQVTNLINYVGTKPVEVGYDLCQYFGNLLNWNGAEEAAGNCGIIARHLPNISSIDFPPKYYKGNLTDYLGDFFAWPAYKIFPLKT